MIKLGNRVLQREYVLFDRNDWSHKQNKDIDRIIINSLRIENEDNPEEIINIEEEDKKIMEMEVEGGARAISENSKIGEISQDQDRVMGNRENNDGQRTKYNTEIRNRQLRIDQKSKPTCFREEVRDVIQGVTTLDSDQKAKLESLLIQNEKVFFELSCLNSYEHKIMLNTDK